ncbi:MAG: S8/S53 family peptidase [Bacteroidia bacterium]
MKQILSIRNLIMATVAGLTIFNQGFSQAPQTIKTPSDRPQYLEKTVIFRVKPQFRNLCAVAGIDDADLQKVFSSLGIATYAKIYPRHKQPETEYNQYRQPLVDLSLIYEVHYTANVAVETVAIRLMRTGKLLYADPHYIYPVTYTPNDPQIGSQYHLNKINAYLGWDVEKGDTNVVVGIVDSGTDPNHPDLAGNIKYNYADPVNGIDDDADGYIDNFTGWDVSENDNDPTVDQTVHGSHVSGCSSATTDNGVGVAGSGFKCKFLPVKAEKASSVDVIENGYESIVYAADHGCNVINCSWGGPGGGQYGQDVINYAVYDKNVTMMVSAGNNNNEVVQYPAAYNNVFAIGSTKANDSKSNFSTYGYFVDMCAPGDNILATVYNNTYTTMSGTSMASPIAAGCAAIVKSHFPAYNGLQVGEQLRVTCDNIYPLNPNYTNKLGKGRINMYNALTVSGPSIRFTNRQFHDGNDDSFVIGDTINVTGYFKNFLAATSNLTATLSTTSTMVTILNSTINLGVINTLDSVSNASNAFTIKINPTAAQNAKILFKIAYSDGTYSDFEIFYLGVNVDYINVAINQISTSITSKGRIGWNTDPTTDGLGFQYNGTQLLYDGGFIVGVDASTVSDVIRGINTGPDADFQSVQSVNEIGPFKSDMDLTGKFNDNPASPPMNLLVTHKSFAWVNPGDDKYVIVEYVIKNNGTSALTNLYAGTIFDWDIMTFALNKASQDIGLKMGYAFSTEVAGLYAGTKLLTSGPFNHYGIDNGAVPIGGVDIVTNGFETSEKYTTISTSRTDAGGTGTGNDVLDVVSTGPFTINPGDSVTVAFALIAGDDLADITQSAINAQIRYNSITAVNELSSSNPYMLAVSPNPATSQTTLHFNLNKAEQIKIEIFNAIGKQVMLVENKNYASGNHSLTLKTTSLAPGVYFIKMNNGKSGSLVKLTVLN